MEALAQVAEKGDQHAIAAVSGRLEDADAHVREAAVGALGQVAEKGDQRAIAGNAEPRFRSSDGKPSTWFPLEGLLE